VITHNSDAICINTGLITTLDSLCKPDTARNKTDFALMVQFAASAYDKCTGIIKPGALVNTLEIYYYLQQCGTHNNTANTMQYIASSVKLEDITYCTFIRGGHRRFCKVKTFLREVSRWTDRHTITICHMGSHRYPAEVTFPPLPQQGWYSI